MTRAAAAARSKRAATAPAVAATRKMAVGQVVVFNIFSEPMTMLSVNGTDVGNIDAWNAGPGGLLYAPAGIPVPRSINPVGGQFFGGTNNVIVNWMGEIFHFDVAINAGQHPLMESLVLLILRSDFALLSSTGILLQDGPLISGPAVVAPAPITPAQPSPEQGGGNDRPD